MGYRREAGGRQPAGGQELCLYKAARASSSQSCEIVQYDFQTVVSFCELGKVSHHRTDRHFKDASSCERAFPVMSPSVWE